MAALLEVSHLTKVFTAGWPDRKSVVAVDDVSFTIGHGEIMALIGLNGAGKTTLTKMMLGLTAPTSGSVALAGDSERGNGRKPRIGYVPEVLGSTQQMTVRQFLAFLGSAGGMSRPDVNAGVARIADELELNDILGTKLGKLSKGTLKRVCLGQALLRNPQILFLDEPTDGLDPLWRRRVKQKLLDLRDAGVTIVINSHILSEIETVAGVVAMMHRGRIIRMGTVRELVPAEESFRLCLAEEPPADVAHRFTQTTAGWVVTNASASELDALVSLLNSRGMRRITIESVHIALEDVFLSLLSNKTV